MDLRDCMGKLDVMNTSPIRKKLQETDKKSIFENEKTILYEIDKIVKNNKSNLKNKLKLVIMGEVKAGKSTLVNYLVGRRVSYTNVLEATAAILEIEHSDKEQVIIKRNEKENIILNTVEELNKLMVDNTDQQFFSDIDVIKVGINSEKLREVTIVDTPGLNTITEKNAQRTDNYIVNSDVILWVINTNHLGQSDVALKIEEVMEYGKPIIAVLNRIDEVDGEYDEIIDYVNCEMGYMFSEIFAISAKEALEGYAEANKSKIENSKINVLEDYLKNTIENNVDVIKLESSLQSINLQVERDLNTHKKAKENLSNILSSLESDYAELNRFNIKCKCEIDNKLQEWIDKKFLETEREQLVNEDMFKFKKSIEKKLNNETLNDKIELKYDSLSRYLLNQWITNMDKIKERNFNSYLEGQILIESEDFKNRGDAVEGLVKGGATGGTVGLALAGYAAWLGPAAAYVSIGSALTACIPPLLIAGLVGGAVWKFTGSDKTNRGNKTDKIITEIKSNVQKQVIPKMRNNLHEISDYYMKSSLATIESILTQCNSSKDEIKVLYEDIDKYIKRIEHEICLDESEYEVENKLKRNSVIS